MRSGQRFITLTALLAISAVALLVGTPAALGNSGRDFETANLPTAYFHPSVLYFRTGRMSSGTTTLTNTSAETLSINSFGITGRHARDLSMTTNCGSSLAGGASCEVTLSCLAPATGPLGKLIESDNSAVGHHDVLLEAK
jgi:hypothetical protein